MIEQKVTVELEEEEPAQATVVHVDALALEGILVRLDYFEVPKHKQLYYWVSEDKLSLPQIESVEL